MIRQKKWKDITPESKKWITGWVAVLCKDMSQKIVWHLEIDDSMIFYYPIPQFLTHPQFKKTNAYKKLSKKEKELLHAMD